MSGFLPGGEETRFWDELLQLIEAGCVIPIVGWDLLTLRLNGRKMLLHAYLAEQVAEILKVSGEDLPLGGELNAVVCRYLDGDRTRNVQDICPALLKATSRVAKLPPPDPLVKLAKITPLKLFVTTTIVPVVEQALNQVRFGGKSKTQILAYAPGSDADLPRDLQRLDRPTVFHLLGRLSTTPNEYAVTDEDLLEWVLELQSPGRPKLLFDELARQQILILGCRYPDWLARFFIRAAAGDRLSTARGRSYLADTVVKDDAALRYFLEHFGAWIRLFNGGAVEFVDELHERWMERHPPNPTNSDVVKPAPNRIKPGAIFLSYAHEDRDTAKAIRDDLERDSLDVWLDLEELETGEPFEDKIRDNIRHCSVFVPLISQHTRTDVRRDFRKEWVFAEEEAKRANTSTDFIVPVVIDDTSPEDSSLPYRFRELHWERLPANRATPELVKRLRKLFRQYQKAHGIS